jgi:hypothetical protein
MVAFAASVTLSAAEYAVLTTGFRLRAERHETAGDRVRLIVKDGGVIEVPASSVVRFEAEDFVPAPVEKPVLDQAPDYSRKGLDKLVTQLGKQLQLHPALVHSVIEAESNYDPDAVSSKGAVGLMQLMPETARELAVEDRRNPHQNVRGGTAYLKQMLDRYAGSRDQLLKALAAYNAGPANVDRYDGMPPYAETRAFVGRVIRRFLQLTEPQASTQIPIAHP